MDVVSYHRDQVGLLPQPVRKGVIPVHIFSPLDHLCGCGTLILGPQGQHRNIFTAGHLFPKGSFGGYYYRLLQPYSHQYFPIEVAKGVSALKEDLAICRPGMNVRAIIGFSNDQPGCNGFKLNAQLTPYLDPQPHVIHILSGKKIPMVGMMVNSTGERYFLLPLETFPGESGLGFLDPEKENAIGVLKGYVTDRSDPALADFARNYPHLSLVAMLGYG